jgi:hypothetical protein
MAVLLVLAFLCFALFLALRLRAEQSGPTQPRLRPALAPAPRHRHQDDAARQPLRPARPSFERPEPQPGTDWLFLLTSTQSNQTIQLDLTNHGHASGCGPGHSGIAGFDPSSCGGHSSGSHGH